MLAHRNRSSTLDPLTASELELVIVEDARAAATRLEGLALRTPELRPDRARVLFEGRYSLEDLS